jgi:ankyrin repeat protein
MPLSWARSPKIVSILVETGASINSTDKDGRTPLSHAVEFESKCEERPKLVQTTIEKGSDVNLSDKNGRPPLFWTCRDFNYNFRQIREIERVINLLLDNGATITSTDNHGQTLL